MNRALALTSAACLLIAGCGSLTSTTVEQPTEAAEVAEVVEAPTDYLAQGKQQGYEAAVAAQTAVDDRWKDVSAQWDLSIASLGQVPTDSSDYATAQAKIVEYTANRDVAAERYRAYQAKAAAPVPAPQAPRNTGKLSDKSLEEKMALIDGLPGRESTYASLLDQLEPKCTENRMLIADMTVKSVQLAGDKGVRTNNLEMLNGLHTVLSAVDFEMECAEIYALVITIMGAE